MKKTLQIYLRSLLLSGLFLMMGTSSYANHISAMDLGYTYVSSTGSGATMSSTYLVTATIYGNCSDMTGAFPYLPTTSPQICVYNGTTLFTMLNLVEQPSESAIKVTNVCNADTGQTTCTSLTLYTLDGIEKYVYTATVTLTGTSAVWRFIYEGYNGAAPIPEAGRANNITSIVGASGSVVYLCDTLNNTAAIPYNTSTTLPIIPTPYYCLGEPDTYNPGATNVLGDSLVFMSVTPRVGTGANTCSSATPGNVTYVYGTAAAPIETASAYSFSSTTGEIAFTTSAAQVTTIDYLVREYRGGVMVGSCMREMNIKTTTCTIPAPSGNMRTATNGAITSDSTTFETCENSGVFSFTIAGLEDSTAYDIYMTASNLPTGATYAIANDSTNHPVATFTWTSTGVTPGTYTFDILYSDNDCPVPSQAVIAYDVIIEPVPSAIAGTPTVCTGSTTTLTDTLASGVWTSSNTTIATAGSGTGIISGVAAGLDTVTYSYSAAACSVTATVNVTGPKAITGTETVCPTLTTTLADVTTGGLWTSSNTAIATVASTSGIVTGVGSGTATITYKLTSTGCYVTAQVTVAALAAIAPASAIVCVSNTVSLTDATSGGIWSSSSTTLATVTATGVVSGVSGGSVDIFYSVGSCYATATVSVSATGPGAISPATATTCVGGTIALTDGSTGGTWSSSTTGVANVNSTTGVVTGVTAGAATISYFLGGCSVVRSVTVISGIAAITPASNVICIGNTVNLIETTTGGTWSSSLSSVATVGTTGTVGGVAAGTSVIAYTVGTCSVSNTVTVSPGPGPISPVPVTICHGTTTTLIDGTTGGTWGSSNTTVASITSGGVVTGATTGTATISYTQAGCSATTVATVGAAPAAILPATAVLCTGNTTTLTESVTGGVWSSNNTAVATVIGGVVSGVGVGTALISYSSGTCVVSATVTVDLAPNPGLITGSSVVCIGGTTGLTDVATGGTWSSSTTANATVSPTGVVSGVALGTTTISYSVAASCGSAYTTLVVSIDAAPSAGTITGSASVCAGTTELLGDLTTGGTWSASNTFATVSSTSGLVTGVSAGIDTIKYTVTSSCGTVSTTLRVTVGAFLSAGTIEGTVNSICAGGTLSLSDATTGGTWGATNTSATVSATGLVTGAAGGGIDTITYTVTSSCGAAVAPYPVTINATPAAAPIVGSSVLCLGSPVLFTDATSGGTWSSSNTANATVTSGGSVTGVALGTATIIYTVTNSCGTSTVNFPVTMSSSVSAGTITGSTSLCIGSTVALIDGAGSGVWSASNTSAEVSSSGIVTGLANGVDTIYYTVTSAGCGSAVASLVVSVSSSVVSAGAIVGPSGVCISSPVTFTNPTASGGDWSSSNSHATITTGGLVTGYTPGLDTISYTITSTCGIASTSKVITISSLSGIDPILGSSITCVGVSTLLTDGTSGGVWSSLNGNAVVSSGGLVTGVAAGTDIISYTFTNACGTYGATFPFTVSSGVSAGTITGPDSVCRGGTIDLIDATATGAGTWSSGNTNASITAGGVVTGVATGTAPISYTVSNTCGTAIAVSIITIVPTATAGTISGPASVCVGSTISLSDIASGGTWLASNANATIVSPGIIEGVTVGTVTISYLVSNICGTSEATKIVAVNPGTVASPIVGPTTQCTGTLILLLDATTGGTWSSFDPAVGTINSVTGVITGMGAGVTELTYTVTNGFGCIATAMAIDTVTATIGLSPITGSTTACIGATIGLSDATSGGVWTSGTTSVATIDPVSGILTGVSTGTVIISYEVVNSCGTSFVVQGVTISPMPTVGSIAGPSTTCVGSTITLTDGTFGGVWSSTNTTIATAGATTGVITGVAPGIVTIDYVYTGSCPLTISTSITVITGAPVDPIVGTTSECVGTSGSLFDGTGVGAWSSSNTLIATVSAGGSVTGISTGTATIFYTVSSGGCTVSAAAIDTVLGIPSESPITGAAAICAGANLTLSNSSPDGAWSSANSAIAVVNALSGVVTGVSGGTDKIYYTVSDICGFALDSVNVTINPGPTVTAISAAFTTLCAGTSVSLSDAGTTGGVWTSSNTGIAIVGSTGVVTGVAGGIDTVVYTVTNADGCSGSAMITLSISGSVLSAAVSPTGSVTICHGHTVFMDVVSTSGSGFTYQWLLNGGAIAGATNSSYTATSVGIYSAVVDNGTCSEHIPGPTVVAPPDPIISFTAPGTLSTTGFAAYEWFLNGILIPTAHGSSVIITGAGTYKVVVTDYNGCSDTSGGYIVTGNGVTSVNAITSAKDIKVYPNPATTVLYIDAPVTVNVSVMSIDGKILMSKNDVSSIDVSGLSDGIYMVMIYDENGLLLKTTKLAKVQ